MASVISSILGLAPRVNPIEHRFDKRITKWHLIVYLILFTSKMPVTWHMLNLMVLNPEMDYKCGDSSDSALRDGTEINACPCDKPDWDRSVFTETVTTYFNLICDKKKLISLSQTLAYFGMLVGAFGFGELSDQCGRLIAFCASFCFIGLAGLGVAWSPHVIAFIVFRWLEGVGAGGGIVTGFVLLVEYTGKRFREPIAALYHLPINIAHLCLAGISYVFRNAFTFQLVVSIPPFLYIFSWLVIDESPLWLLSKKKVEKAVKAMERIAKFNNDNDTGIRSELESFARANTGGSTVKMQIYHICKHKKLTIYFVCMAYLYVVCGLGYYGVSQYISKMSGNIHANIAISATLLIPGTALSAVLLKLIGRKPFLMTSCLGSGIFMLITVLIPKTFNPAFIKVIFACISNTFFFMAFIVVFLYGVELFPTQIRNSALGFLSLLSRAGMMAAPQINTLSQTVAGYTYAIMALLGSILTIVLPETKNRDLPATMEEANAR